MSEKTITRRRLMRTGLIGGLGALGLAALAGCGEEQAAKTTAAATAAATTAATKAAEKVATTAGAATAKPQTAELEWWHQALVQMDPALDQIVKDYAALKPSVKVTLNRFPFADYTTKLLTSLGGGVAPDITYVHPEFIVLMAAKGAIEPLDSYFAVDKSFPLDDFHPGNMKAMSYKGKNYVIPLFHGPWLFIYNRPIVEKLGLGDPWELHKKGEWTLKKYQEMIQAATTGAGDQKVFGGIEVPSALKLQYLWVWGFGGKVWDNEGAFDDPKAVEFNSPKAIEAWTWMIDHVKKEVVPSRAFATAFQGGTQGLFVSNKVAIYQSHRSFTTRIPPDSKAGTAPMYKMPNGDDESRDAPEGIGMHKLTKNKEAAWELMSYIGLKGVDRIIAAGVTAPTRKSQMTGEVFKNSIVPWDNIEVHLAASKQLKVQFFQPIQYGAINKIVQTAYDKVVLGQTPVQQAFDEAKREADAALKET